MPATSRPSGVERRDLVPAGPPLPLFFGTGQFSAVHNHSEAYYISLFAGDVTPVDLTFTTVITGNPGGLWTRFGREAR